MRALSTIGNAAPPQLTGPYAYAGGGDSRFALQIGNADFQADRTRSEARLVSRFRLRAAEGLPASLHVGDRYPIVTARFSSIVSAAELQNLQPGGQFREPVPAFNFEDLGIVLKVTPRVHDDHEVSLAVEAEFRVLTGVSFNDLPVISTRRINSTVRLREGEAGMISGIELAQTSRSWGGTWPFSHLPLLGRLLRGNSRQRDESDLLLTIRPRLVREGPANQFPSRTYYTGTEGRPATSL